MQNEVKRFRGGACFLCLLCLMLFVNPVQSASFKIHPLKLSFDKNTKSTVLKVNNLSNHPVTVQIEISKWLQNEKGEDVYQLTSDLIFFPKIVTLKVGEERVVRIGYKGRYDGLEKSYRLFARELPKQGEGTLKFALRFSIPLFVKTSQPGAVLKLLSSEVKNQKLNILVANSGNSHDVVSEINVRGLSGSGETVFSQEEAGWYVLANGARLFRINLRDACEKTQRIEYSLKSGKSQLKQSVSVTPSNCIAKDRVGNAVE